MYVLLLCSWRRRDSADTGKAADCILRCSRQTTAEVHSQGQYVEHDLMKHDPPGSKGGMHALPTLSACMPT